MFAKVPINLDKIKEENVDKDILRATIIAELDAINVYEQMAALTKNQHLKVVLLEVAKEEKTHVGEFLESLLRLDSQQATELEEGKKEIAELIKE